MKKTFLLLIAVVTLAGSLWFSVGASNGPSITTTVYSEFFTDAQAGDHVPASLFAGEVELQELPCKATENPGTVSCRFPANYAGQQVAIQLAKNGIMFVYFVDVPAR